ncbi:MAG: hypothetical protein GF398_00610 [Chitinivibrionales bacterium]|nr:hypothetical protein [Chitinivibrionales bacterium]
MLWLKKKTHFGIAQANRRELGQADQNDGSSRVLRDLEQIGRDVKVQLAQTRNMLNLIQNKMKILEESELLWSERAQKALEIDYDKSQECMQRLQTVSFQKNQLAGEIHEYQVQEKKLTFRLGDIHCKFRNLTNQGHPRMFPQDKSATSTMQNEIYRERVENESLDPELHEFKQRVKQQLAEAIYAFERN